MRDPHGSIFKHAILKTTLTFTQKVVSIKLKGHFDFFSAFVLLLNQTDCLALKTP